MYEAVVDFDAKSTSHRVLFPRMPQAQSACSSKSNIPRYVISRLKNSMDGLRVANVDMEIRKGSQAVQNQE